MLRSRKQRKEDEEQKKQYPQPTSGYLRPKKESKRRIDQAFDHLDKKKKGSKHYGN